MPIKLLLFETTPESFYDLELFGGGVNIFTNHFIKNNLINKTITNEKK